MVEGSVASGYTQWWRGGRVVECGGLENRYVGNPGVGGSNPPLSAIRVRQFGESFIESSCPERKKANLLTSCLPKAAC